MTSQVLGQNWHLSELPGVSNEILEKLAACNITTTSQLLVAAPTLAQRQHLARSLTLRDQVISKTYAMADLARLPSVGPQYCGLLLHCGIHSCAQLALSNAGQLHRHVLRFQVAMLRQKNLCPQLVDIVQWIQQAQRLKQINAQNSAQS